MDAQERYARRDSEPLESSDAQGRASLDVDGKLQKSTAENDVLALLDEAERWKTQFLGRSWFE